MSDQTRDAAGEIARAIIPTLPRAEPMSLNEACAAIRANANTQCPPAVASLLRRLATMHVASLLPSSLALYVIDVGRELVAPSTPEGDQAP